MQQLTQQLRSGQIEIRELPLPQVGPGMVQVRNHFSLISAGTESSTVRAARKSLIGKVKERPQQAMQVLDTLRQQGPVQTYRAVMKKLEAYSPLGYSSAGVVMTVGEGVTGFQVGDPVACAGVGYASHAEVVSCPVNLCVKLSRDADLKSASFNTLGAIAMQGVRQADLRIGESCAVIGLGLLGQLTCLLLRAAGVRVFGIDVDGAAVKNAAEYCADRAWERGESGLEDAVAAETGGIGVDAVIITAATSSLDPVNFAGALARMKGKVVVVGDVPTGFDRAPHYYNKELDLRMSCSYGPGRYDPDYEEKGRDYPVGYVRWTEKRNMEAFQDLMLRGKVDIGYLITHVFELEKAAEAYDMILEKTEPFIGVLLEYDHEKPIKRGPIELGASRPAGSGVNLAFVGAGSYAQGNLLPNIPKQDSVSLRKILTNSGTTARRVADQFGFEACAEREEDIFEADGIDTVFIATRHDTHGDYVRKAISRKLNVFVEKPLCLSSHELEQIESAYTALGPEAPMLMVGFNRRFSPLSVKLKSELGGNPMSIIYRVNAGAIPGNSWIQDPEVGGGRIIGEVCHFIDYATFLTGSLPRKVYATSVPDPEGNNDTVAINLEFADGSIASVMYFSNGSKAMPKEHVEVFQSGQCAVLRDFRMLEFFSGKPAKSRLPSQDKGQKPMMEALFRHLLEGGEAPIPVSEILAVHRATFGVIESLRTGAPCELGY